MAGPDWIALAVVTQPHGVDGRVKIKSFTEPPEEFSAHVLRDAQGNAVKLTVGGQARGQFIAKIDGIDDRNAAELWRGRELGIPSSALKPISKAHRYYIRDLIGMEVLEGGDPAGTVVQVFNFGAGDIVEIEFAEGARELYAFTQATFPEIDTAARRMTFLRPLLTGSKAEEVGGE
ncbi:MAG: ribosome maturation factor RimM [Alphaproteobacteria bacterium]